MKKDYKDFVPLDIQTEAKLYHRAFSLWLQGKKTEEMYEELANVQAKIVYNYLTLVTKGFTDWRRLTRWDARAMARAYSEAWACEAFDLFFCTGERLKQLSGSPEFWVEMQRYGSLIDFRREVWDKTVSRTKRLMGERGYSYAVETVTIGRVLYFASIWAAYGPSIIFTKCDPRIEKRVAALKNRYAWMDEIAKADCTEGYSGG